MKTLIVALALATAIPHAAAQAPAPVNRFAASIAPAERFEVGGLLVERHGQGGRPLVLIPGLSSGAWAWQGVVRAFAPERAVYVVTLPGFDGRPPAGAAPVAAALRDLRALIDRRHLVRPVLVGHSMGGALAFALAAQAPQLVGGVVSIDGLPVFPGNEDLSPPEREAAAAQLRRSTGGGDARVFAQNQQRYMRTIGVLDISRADALAELSARSDPASVAAYLGEMLALDLRAQLPAIVAPVLVVAPWFDADDLQNGQSEQAKADYYRSLLAGTPRAEVVTVAPSRHFVMFDQPDKLNALLRSYLARLP